MKVATLFAGCAWLAFGAVPAFAQVAQAPAAAPAPDQLEEVVVTSQRRSENLQTVAISAAALSSQDLKDKAVTRLSDLQFATPSLSITEGGLVQSANIRGIGLASGSPSVANGVATYLDGLFQPPIVQTGSFYDIAGVEVLRGPQGTLVGSNSTGGAIFINSRNPQLGTYGGYAEAGVGNYNAVNGQGAVNIPVGDELAFRVAGTARKRDSYYTDLGPYHNDAGKLDEKGARLGVLWRPGKFQALLKSDYVEYDTGGFAQRPAVGSQYAAGRTSSPWLLNYNSPTGGHQQGWVNSLELRYELDNGITVRGIGGRQDKHVDLLIDNDASALASVSTDQYVRERQLSGEVNIISPSEWRLNWIVGGYYQRNQINVRLNQTDPAGVGLNVSQEQYKYTRGVFAQANYKFTDQLELQTGVRYSDFKAEGTGAVRIGVGVPGFPPGGLQVADLGAGHKDGRYTGKVALNYTVDPRNLVYGFIAKGYKPGGYNSAVSEFDPEIVWNYEVGWKSTLADGHLRTQLDAFYNDYTGFQFGVIDTTSGQNGVMNLSKGKIWGIEGQAQARFSGFGFDVSGAYIDSELSAFQTPNPNLLPAGQLGPQCAVGTPSNPPTCFNYGPYLQTAGGGPNLLSPKWTYNLGAQYTFEWSGGRSLTPRLNYAYVADQWGGLFYTPADRLKARGLLSALVTYDSGKAWRIEAYGNNLADKAYVAGSGTSEFYGPPREYGVRLNVNF
jgi:iron complex outermembrane receptor protein